MLAIMLARDREIEIMKLTKLYNKLLIIIFMNSRKLLGGHAGNENLVKALGKIKFQTKQVSSGEILFISL